MSVKQLLDLSGKVAFITGGSRGLGLQMAEALGELGAKIAISARKQHELDAAKEHLESQGVTVVTIAADLGDLEGIPKVVDQVIEQLDANEHSNLEQPMGHGQIRRGGSGITGWMVVRDDHPRCAELDRRAVDLPWLDDGVLGIADGQDSGGEQPPAMADVQRREVLSLLPCEQGTEVAVRIRRAVNLWTLGGVQQGASSSL